MSSRSPRLIVIGRWRLCEGDFGRGLRVLGDSGFVPPTQQPRGTPMFRTGNGGGGRRPPRNVLGLPLEPCSLDPITGFFRNGCCDTAAEDIGSHTVCVVATED